MSKRYNRLIYLLLILLFVGCQRTSPNDYEVVMSGECLFAPSPRFDQTLYECNNDGSLWLAKLPNLSNPVLLKIANNAYTIWSMAAWRPDGTAFLLESYDSRKDTETWWLVETEDFENKIPLCTLPAREQLLRWAPDGTKFAIVDRSGSVTITSIDHRECNKLPISGLVMKSLSISWSPDSQKIAYTYISGKNLEAEIHVIDLSTLETTQIYSDGGLPEWSPAGEKIALFGLRGVIPVIQADGSGLISEVTIPEGYTIERSNGTVWSPDGSHLAIFLRRNDATSGNVGILDVNKLTLSVFEVPSLIEILSWTLDGKALIIKESTSRGIILKKIFVDELPSMP